MFATVVTSCLESTCLECMIPPVTFVTLGGRGSVENKRSDWEGSGERDCYGRRDGTIEVKETAVVGVVPFRRRFTSERLWLSTKYSMYSDRLRQSTYLVI